MSESLGVQFAALAETGLHLPADREPPASRNGLGLRRRGRPQAVPLRRKRERLIGALVATTLVLLIALGAAGFSYLSVQRHEAYLSNAEDLGFTDQVVWSWLRGQAFRLSMYEQAAFGTDVDLASLKRPDSLLAFHVEPMLALLAPLYLVWSDVRLLLVVQALGWALGAWPTYLLARRRLDSRLAGLAFAAAYLLSPLGQWGVLSDLHTVLLAAPLLLWLALLLEQECRVAFVLVALLAMTAKEEVGLAVAGLGLLALGRPRMRLAGLLSLGLGLLWPALCVTLIIPSYAGTAISPFTARYAELGGSPLQVLLNFFRAPRLFGPVLTRPEVQDYLRTLLLSGGWVALLGPELLLPALPSLALNLLSNSPWMASGRAHYSAIVLPFLLLAAIGGAARLSAWLRGDRPTWLSPGARLARVARHLRGAGQALRRVGRPRWQPGALYARLRRDRLAWLRSGWRWLNASRGTPVAPSEPRVADRPTGAGGVGRAHWSALLLSALVLMTTFFAYLRDGAGPLSDGFASPQRRPVNLLADQVIASLPPDARVSASSNLYPHLSQRRQAYLFPTVRDAEYTLLDLAGASFPTSAGDVALRVNQMLGSGEWEPLIASDGLLLLQRAPWVRQPLTPDLLRFARSSEREGCRLNGAGSESGQSAACALRSAPLSPTSFEGGALELVGSSLDATGELGPNGPLGRLETWWRVTRPLVGQPRPRLYVQLTGGLEQVYWDFAPLWWYPTERWRVGELVRLEVAGLPMRQVLGWRAEIQNTNTVGQPALPRNELTSATAEAAPAAARSAERDNLTDPLELRLGELTVLAGRATWRLAVLDPEGRLLWAESPVQAGDRRGPLGFKLADGSWWHLTSLLDAKVRPDGATLTAATDDPGGRTATVELTSLGPRSFRLQLALADSQGVVALAQAVPSATDERLVGFGQRFSSVDQRGRIVTNWTEDRRVAGYGDTTYAPLPLLISSRGYSLALETDVRSVFDLAVERLDRYAWEVETNAISLVFSYGPSPRDLVQQQVVRTGRPPLPPIWAFGVVKTAVGGQDQVLQDATRLRQLGIPVSALFVSDAVDLDANIGWPTLTYTGKRPGPYFDLRALTDRLHGWGYRALAYYSPDFHADRPNYAEPARRGFLLKSADGRAYLDPTFQLSWLDLTNPDAVAWWDQLWRRSLIELGFDGGMLDLGELTPVDARYRNGLDGRTMHNRYPLLYAQAAYESLARYRSDGMLFVRSGATGAQAFQHAQWPGDPYLDWSATNGLKSLLPAALSFGLSGFPYWHPEVAGYLARGLPPASERELWLRWLQFGAFSPLLRDQYGDHQVGGPPVEMWSDQSTIEAFRTYARWHNRLVPYLYSYARVATETGLPLIRYLPLSYPNDAQAWAQESEYLLGEELLVAPVLDEGARSRTAYLPAGQWVDFWSGALYDGGREVIVPAPLDRIPVFARAGAILPQAADFDTLSRATEPDVRSWNGDLVVRVFRHAESASSTFRLYDGTEMAYSGDGRRVSFTLRGGSSARSIELHLPTSAAPSAVTVDEQPTSSWRFDPAAGELILNIKAADARISVQP